MQHVVLFLVAGVAVAGVVAQWVGWRFRIPSILVLLLVGLAAGPVFGWVKPGEVLGHLLDPAVGMAVAIIVFEGGLNLNLRELHTAGSGVRRLILIALPLNGLFGALAAHFIGHLAWPVAVLFGSIMVVTGPTVIIPLLRQARLKPRVAAFLKWEAIVNDPIGAVLTLLILSFALELHRRGEHSGALWILAARAAAGALVAGGLGAALPFGLRYIFGRDLAPEYLKAPILLAGALGLYAVGEAIQPETGLVGATVFGVVLANIEITGLQDLHRFKESLTIFLVSGLFILLTANIDLAVIKSVSWPIILTAVAMLLLARPAAIAIATIGAKMAWKERVLLGWIAPRGVVAAAVAGLAGQQLAAAGMRDGGLILPMVFLVIAASVAIHGLTLAPMARILGLASNSAPGLLIVGASPWTVALARALQRLDIPVLIADPDWHALRPARKDGLPTTRIEILSARGDQSLDLRDLDYLLVATDDDAYNALVCTRFAPEFGRERVHQLPPSQDSPHAATAREWRGKYTPHPELTNAKLNALVGEGYDFEVRSSSELSGETPVRQWPVVVLDAAGTLSFFSSDQEISPVEGDRIVCFELPQGRPKHRRADGAGRTRQPSQL